MTHPTFREEKKFWKKGYTVVIGTDEVGRGAFAGPVVAAAVALDNGALENLGINDSKLLTPKLREKLAKEIKKQSVWVITEVGVSVINKVGIGKATTMAFRKAITSITDRVSSIKGCYVLVDGFHVKYIKGIGSKKQKAIIKGDQKSITIAAASIIAKVYRDRLMKHLHKLYPMYGFAKHKGYGTREHQAAIKKHGLSKIHRKSFNLSPFLPLSLSKTV